MIDLVIEQRRRDLGGFEVGRVLPFAKRRMVGPFIFFDRMGPVDFPPGIPRSVDVLVMMLLGGMNALFGPLLGAIAFTWLSDVLARYTDYWRAGVGIAILLIVSVFPFGIGGASLSTPAIRALATWL